MGPTLSDLRAALAHPSPELHAPGARHAAVAAVFTRDLRLLFMRRAEHPRDPWSGHVSFPGGRAEPEDAHSLATAIRETREELGLDLAGADVLGALGDVGTAAHLPELVVRPWVFQIDELPPLTPNHEVASVHLLPLASLAGGVGRTCFDYDWKGHRVTLPCVQFEGVRLWGMTLRMVDDLLNRLDGRGIGLARQR